MIEPEIYLVGGIVRDTLLNKKGMTKVKSKDVDYSIVLPDRNITAAEGVAQARKWLEAQGFHVFTVYEDKATVRAKFPEGYPRPIDVPDADFCVARKDGHYSDGRRPDVVFVGTLEDDLLRRDFTVNAMAMTLEGELIDIVGGEADLEARLLRCVGNTFDRMSEDKVRILRAIRLAITKDLGFSADLHEFLRSETCRDMIANEDVNKRRDELAKAFEYDSVQTFRVLENLMLTKAALTDLRLRPTNKEGRL